MARLFEFAYAGNERNAQGNIAVDLNFLVGAIIGSGIAIFAGRAPTQRLLDAVQARLARRR